MEKKFYNLSLRSLIYEEDGVFYARCLEMDLIGTGESPQKALAELQSNIEAQITFAMFKKDDGLLMFPAEQVYFERWEKANQAQIHDALFPGKLTEDKALKMNGCSVIIEIEKKDLDKLRKPHQFSSVKEPVIA